MNVINSIGFLKKLFVYCSYSFSCGFNVFVVDNLNVVSEFMLMSEFMFGVLFVNVCVFFIKIFCFGFNSVFIASVVSIYGCVNVFKIFVCVYLCRLSVCK